MRSFCEFRRSCYGGLVPKSRLADAARVPANKACGMNVARQNHRRRFRKATSLLTSMLALVLLAACGHINLSTPPPPPPTPSTSQSGPTSCSVGQDWCMGSCIDTIKYMNDSSNCGRCGNHCSFSETCTGGFCTCGPGYESCMGRCVSSASFIGDSSNCGRCGNICMGGEACIGGSCRKL